MYDRILFVCFTQNTPDFTEEDKRRLFGDDFRDAKSMFKQLDTSGDGQVS